MLISEDYKKSLAELSFAERHLEPESMEETALEYDAMDFSATNAAFVEFISPLIPPRARVADMGCGPGDIPLILAERRPDLSVVGVDLSPAMLELAEQKARDHALNIEWKAGDITQPLFAAGEIDFVISHTTLHHLPDLEPFFRELARMLGPRGGFALRDLRRPATPELAMEWIQKATSAPLSKRQFELFFYSLRASFTLKEVQKLAEGLQLGGVLEASTNPDRYWTFYRSANNFSGHII